MLPQKSLTFYFEGGTGEVSLEHFFVVFYPVKSDPKKMEIRHVRAPSKRVNVPELDVSLMSRTDGENSVGFASKKR